MRDLVFTALMGMLLMIACARPFVGLMLWSWISFMNVHRLSWGMAQSLPWAQLTFFATLVGCAVAKEPKRFRPTLIMIMLAVFALMITVTSFAALQTGTIVWNKWDRVFKIILGLLLTGLLLTERWRIHAMIWLMVIGIGYFGVRGGAFTLMTGGGFIVLGPPDSMIKDRNHLAVGLLLVLPLMYWLWLHSRHAIVRLGLVAAMVLTVFAVVGSQSRGALVGLAAVSLVLWLRTPKKILSGAAMALAIAGAINFMPESWVERMETMRDYQTEGSAAGRLKIWQASYDIAVGRPLVGGGFRAMYSAEIIARYSDPNIPNRAAHSIYFEVLGEHGFVVFGWWLLMIFVGVWYTFRIISLSRNRPELRWAFDLARMAQVSITAYLVGGAFVSLSYWDVWWTLVVMLGATHALVKAAVSSPAGAADAAAQSPAAAGAGGWAPQRPAAVAHGAATAAPG